LADEFGVLVDPADPADIAQGLLKALSSPEAWQRYHKAGLERVITRYTWDRTAEGYLAVIEQALRSRPATTASKLPIPAYFIDPSPDNEISLNELANLYFGG